ncbi:MAG: transcriptional repressor NrdR [Rhodospirillales bacterium]|nr:transcriptional repressor NrdR [Rhodospirillales bacterium]
MRCPFCGYEDSQVKDSRPAEDGASIRRRRSCPKCEARFTTFERVQLREITVIKAGNKRQPFDRDKMLKSMQIALRKRPVELEEIEKAANAIVRQLEKAGDAEVPSTHIGELVMHALAQIDTVGYIRYASVYRDFRHPEDFDSFLQEVRELPHSKQAAE